VYRTLKLLLAQGGIVAVEARKILLATGVQDELPETPGFRELWGRGVYHCPYCHGWEVRERPLAVLARGEELFARVTLIRNWSRDLVVLTDGAPGPDDAARARLDALGVPVRDERIARLEGDGAAGGLRRIVFEDGSEIARDGLFYAPPQGQRSGLAEALGCEIVAMGPFPAVVRSDPMSRETTVPGVYVAGDAGTMLQGAIMAAASGATAASFANHALAKDDIEAELAAAPAAQHEPGGTNE
jgi:thioredoxin reductase